MASRSSFRLLITAALALMPLLAACAPFSIFTKVSYVEPNTGMEFVYVPAGDFQMGDLDREPSQEEATPVHQVHVPGLYVSRYEVTFEQYDKFCADTNRTPPSDNGWGRGNRPVINVTWDDANALAQWLRQKNGLAFNLPSEAQWEYFARAGTKTHYWYGDEPKSKRANCQQCSTPEGPAMTMPVGSFRSNSWGIYDTMGNVSEWTLDSYHASYLGAPADGSAWLDDNSETKMLRGGDWMTNPEDLKSSIRWYEPKTSSGGNFGIRLVIAADPNTAQPLTVQRAQ